MKVYMSGSVANLVGDWSISEVTQNNLDTLSAALRQINPTCAKKLLIDCRQVNAIDITGQQILNVWMQCVRLRGVEPELVIPSNNLRQVFQSFGLRCRYTSRNSERHTYTPHHRKRRAASISQVMS